jgi:hypothetical protein
VIFTLRVRTPEVLSDITTINGATRSSTEILGWKRLGGGVHSSTILTHSQVPRLTLALGGKFPGTDYENLTYGFNAAPQHLPAENLGRMPVLTENGKTVGQSGAIWRYVARREGFFGSSMSVLCILVCSLTFFVFLVPFPPFFFDFVNCSCAQS